MATLSEYFEAEAQEALTQIESALAAHEPDAQLLHRAARSLRGTAQLARVEPVARVGAALEAAARALGSGELSWSDPLRQAWRDSARDLRTLIPAGDGSEDPGRTAAEIIDRLQQLGTHVSPAVRAQGDEEDDAEFLRFAAREVGGIVDVLDGATQQLASAPMDREPLKDVLRRQRALLGAARIDEVPVVAEILRAVEDLTRVVARLDVGVKQEWYDVYRIARDGLRQALEPLQRGELPGPSNASSRLRHMRQELLERYGSGEPAAAADAEIFAPAPEVLGHSPEQVVTTGAAAGASPPDGAPDLLGAASNAMERAAGVVPVEELLYTPEDALRQALALRDTILRATAHDVEAHAAAEELFDLLRDALG